MRWNRLSWGFASINFKYSLIAFLDCPLRIYFCAMSNIFSLSIANFYLKKGTLIKISQWTQKSQVLKINEKFSGLTDRKIAEGLIDNRFIIRRMILLRPSIPTVLEFTLTLSHSFFSFISKTAMSIIPSFEIWISF